VLYRRIALVRRKDEDGARDCKKLLFANKNQNARCQRQDSHYDSRDRNVNERHESSENQIDSEQEHSEVFGDVHVSFLRESPSFCTLRIGR
jgi:hypothetical protein